MVYYGKVPNTAMYDPELSIEAKGLFAIICSLSGSNGYCFPKVETLCKYSGRHRTTVHRLLKELTLKGYIERHFDPGINKHIITITE
jgi:DNA-binding MarR family transcriptional regulator